MRIRIKATPYEREIDGVKLSTLTPGSVRDVSSTLGLWLIAQGYAQPEMREESSRENSAPDSHTHSANDQGLRRRYTDRPKTRS